MLNKIKRSIILIKHSIKDKIKDMTGYNKAMNQYVGALDKFYTLTMSITNNRLSGSDLKPSLKATDILQIVEEENLKDKYKFLAQELESILNIMNEKGKHPKDIIRDIIREAKRYVE